MFNVARGLIYDLIISADTGEEIGIDEITHRFLKKNLVGTVAPIRPVSSAYVSPRTRAQGQQAQQQAPNPAARLSNIQDDRLRKQMEELLRAAAKAPKK